MLGVFVVPNSPISKDCHLDQFQVPLEYVESKSGLQILPRLDRKAVHNLCTVVGCQLIPWDQFELYIIRHKLESARTLHRLNKVWKELEEKYLKPDSALRATYNVKYKELQKTNSSQAV